jgi:hypothetical protein
LVSVADLEKVELGGVAIAEHTPKLPPGLERASGGPVLLFSPTAGV